MNWASRPVAHSTPLILLLCSCVRAREYRRVVLVEASAVWPPAPDRGHGERSVSSIVPGISNRRNSSVSKKGCGRMSHQIFWHYQIPAHLYQILHVVVESGARGHDLRQATARKTLPNHRAIRLQARIVSIPEWRVRGNSQQVRKPCTRLDS